MFLKISSFQVILAFIVAIFIAIAMIAWEKERKRKGPGIDQHGERRSTFDNENQHKRRVKGRTSLSNFVTHILIRCHLDMFPDTPMPMSDTLNLAP